MTVSAVVFDLDYTLAVPERDRATLLEEALARTGGPSISREEYLAAHRRNLTRETRAPIFDELLAARDSDVPPEAVAAAYRKAVADALVPVPGVEELLSALRETYRIGLLTNGPVRAQRDKLRTLGWEDRFDATIVTGTLEAGKPDGRAFRAVLDALSVEPGEAVYVGDEAEADVGGASAAGMYVVQVTFPGGPEVDPRADATVDRAVLGERLPGIVASLGD